MRKVTRWPVIGVWLVLVVACGARPEPMADRAPRPAGAQPSATPTRDDRAAPTVELPAELLATVASRLSPGSTLGAVVYDRTTGTASLEYHAGRPFASASLVKLLVAISVLEQGAGAGDRGRIARMLRTSDDGLANLYWVQQGGPGLVTRTAAALGLTGVRAPDVAGQWGQTLVTPHDIVAIYRHVLAMPPADRALIVGALAHAPRLAADGVDQHFGIPDGLDTGWAVKQGWGTSGRTTMLHSTGLVGPDLRYIVVLLTEHPPGTGWRTGGKALTATAAALHGRLPGV